ncbi:Arginine/ornithine antiporter [Geobacillus thermodenitrificans NG80-2]|uniref:Arginine/ornithine antiporter n=2 Tax=Geobacillus thermodenitrificans TaxID=33940 RepID=A4ILM4_GEOTN|nr:Arginine/ornithine antiporter [Geobacillus thermodenitrificans NG80-2]
MGAFFIVYLWRRKEFSILNNNRQLGFWVLTALVVGNMVGSGIFMLPRSLAEAASPLGVMFAWLLTGAGVLATALVFGNLAIRKPNLSGGPQIYAKELFPKGSNLSILSGFMSSWGYWVGNFAGNVAIITTLASYLSTFFPVLTSDKTVLVMGSFTLKLGNLLTFIICTVLLWVTHVIILQGVEGAGKLNFAATAAKVLGFFLFIVIALFAFDKAVIGPLDAPRYDGNGQPLSLLGQINNAALSALWAFIGVESAMVFAARARKQADVKRATIAGLLISLVIYIGISILVMGVLPQDKLIQSDKPLVDAIVAIIGPIGGYVLAGLGLISLIGSTLGWILLSAEVPYQAAKQGMFMPAFLRENKRRVPNFSLLLSNLAAQLFIFSTISNSIAAAFDFVIYIATLAYLVPYLIASVFQLKLVLTGETYEAARGRLGDGIIAVFATVYSIWVVIAGTADMKTFLLGVALLTSGVIFYPQVKKAAQQTNEKEKLSA